MTLNIIMILYLLRGRYLTSIHTVFLASPSQCLSLFFQEARCYLPKIEREEVSVWQDGSAVAEPSAPGFGPRWPSWSWPPLRL